MMSDIPRYPYQVSPELPAGASPGQIISGFHPPDLKVGQAVAGGVTDAVMRIAQLTEQIQAADKSAELARARADYYKKMTEWTLTLPQSDIDPLEYRNEFDRESNAVAGEISKGFRHAETLDAFTTWKTGQDASFFADVLKTQLVEMNDRFGAAQKKDLELLKDNPGYLPTYIKNIEDAARRGAVNQTAAQTAIQAGQDMTEVSNAREAIKGMSLAEASEWMQMGYTAPGLTEAEKTQLLAELQQNEQIREDELRKKDEEYTRYFADKHLKVGTVADIYAALKELADTPFHDGDKKHQIEGWFTSLLPSPGEDPLKNEPDPTTLDTFLDIKYALNNPGMKLPNDPRYGEMAGKEPTVPLTNAWLSTRMYLMGNRYRPEREYLMEWKSDAFSWADGEIDKFMKSDNPLKKQISWQQAAEMKTNLRNYFRGQNPTQAEMGKYIEGQVMGMPKPLSQDQGTTGSGAELGVRIWNGQFPNWTWMNDPTTAKQVEGKAILQAAEIGKYLDKPPDTLASLPKETQDQMGLSQKNPVDLAKNYLITESGVALFHANGKWLAYVPAYDPAKPAGQKYSGGKETLMEYNPGDPDPGKRWKPYVVVPKLEKPSKGTKLEGGLSAEDIGKMKANEIKNKINDLKVKKQNAQKQIDRIKKEIETYYPETLSGREFMPLYRQQLENLERAQEALKTYELNAINLEEALKQRQGGK